MMEPNCTAPGKSRRTLQLPRAIAADSENKVHLQALELLLHAKSNLARALKLEQLESKSNYECMILTATCTGGRTCSSRLVQRSSTAYSCCFKISQSLQLRGMGLASLSIVY